MILGGRYIFRFCLTRNMLSEYSWWSRPRGPGTSPHRWLNLRRNFRFPSISKECTKSISTDSARCLFRVLEYPKLLSSIWHCLSCPPDERITKISKKYDYYNDFLRADHDRTKDGCHIFAISSLGPGICVEYFLSFLKKPVTYQRKLGVYFSIFEW